MTTKFKDNILKKLCKAHLNQCPNYEIPFYFRIWGTPIKAVKTENCKICPSAILAFTKSKGKVIKIQIRCEKGNLNA